MLPFRDGKDPAMIFKLVVFPALLVSTEGRPKPVIVVSIARCLSWRLDSALDAGETSLFGKV
jgi:hypothetical protein